ncbi:MAG: PEP-CTERM sorting domain-containing protein [Planctomycetia bacterium]|nr:PEP-CTERM sorting domain-containing protein [Planctomycetia bacterium]
MRIRTRGLLLAALAAPLSATPALAAPIVPGFTVEHYADVTDPAEMTFNPATGDLYVGRDNSGSGGSQAEAVKIHLFAPGGATVTEFGDTAIPDPDSVLFDATGDVSGVPGSVLVAGRQVAEGALRAIHPDQTTTLLFHVGSGLVNPNGLKFDSTGRVIIADNLGPVAASTGGNPTILYNLGGVNGTIAIDADDNIYTDGPDGVIRIHAADGSLVNGNFYTDPNPGPGGFQLEFGPGGPLWGDSLYGISRDTGELLRFDALGVPTVIGTGFGGPGGPTAPDMEFGPDGALYVALFSEDEIIRIVPEPGSLALLGIGFGAALYCFRRR